MGQLLYNRVRILPQHFRHARVTANAIDTGEIVRSGAWGNTIGAFILVFILDHTKCTAGCGVIANLRSEFRFGSS